MIGGHGKLQQGREPKALHEGVGAKPWKWQALALGENSIHTRLIALVALPRAERSQAKRVDCRSQANHLTILGMVVVGSPREQSNGHAHVSYKGMGSRFPEALNLTENGWCGCETHELSETKMLDFDRLVQGEGKKWQ